MVMIGAEFLQCKCYITCTCSSLATHNAARITGPMPQPLQNWSHWRLWIKAAWSGATFAGCFLNCFILRWPLFITSVSPRPAPLTFLETHWWACQLWALPFSHAWKLPCFPGLSSLTVYHCSLLEKLWARLGLSGLQLVVRNADAMAELITSKPSRSNST